MAENKHRSEEELWIAFTKGDRSAFETMYRQHAQELISYGYRITGNRAVIEDSIHDLFVELWQSRERLSLTASIRFYLFRALRNKITRSIRQDEAMNLALRPHSIHDVALPYETLLITVEVQSEQLAHLQSTIKTLPERQREAINLRYYHNFSNEEVAEIMGVNYQSACKFIYTALRKLKENLKIAVSSFLLFQNFF